MSNTDIKKLIQEEYMIDVDSIRNLSKLANNLTLNGKLTVPGGLEIQGPLTVSKNITAKGGLNIGSVNIKPNGEIHGRDIHSTHSLNTKGNLTVNGTATFNNKIIGKNGGDFSGGRYYFTDTEKCGKLRVGCAWGVPGIYAEGGKHLTLGSSAGEVQFQNNSSRIKGNTGTFSTVNTSTVNTSTANASKVNISGSSVSLLTFNKTNNDQTNLIEFKHKGKRKQRFGLDGNSKPWYGSLRGWY